ncbi:MAG: glycosyltransferase [Clostridia bacterium]|nr:glycosyltransferase [Clostridia bacterium]
MKVSIIVPVYNVEKYLDECVSSLINQTMQEIQIVLVDDGSTDRSGKMIDDYAALDNRIVALHKENGGQSSARNLGLQNATGEYILYVDSDDYIVSNACERLYETAVHFAADIVQGDLKNEEKRIMEELSFRQIPSEEQVVPVWQFMKEKIQTETYDIVSFLYLVRRTLVIREGLLFPEGYTYEDQLHTFQLLTTDASIVKIRFPFYFYRMDRPGSTTNHIVLKRGTDAAHICSEMYSRYLKLGPRGGGGGGGGGGFVWGGGLESLGWGGSR